ncbi:extracellular solute-binding protein [Streptococcus sp. X16XC17]|nr:extracellular solute-binding protein [Streptococcus sp. X16XC17]TCD45931.1 extracellular solute-binding protein [Streptococcus sp. X16XC17]
MKKRNLTAILAGSVLSVLLLTACASDGDASKKSDSGATEVTVWAWDPNFNIKAFEIAEEVYDKAYPDKVDLKIVENAQDDIVQKLNTTLSSGVTDGLPNIVLIEDYCAKSFLEAYPDSFFPLTDLIEADDFAKYKIEATSVDGINYAVPFDTGVTGLYVRTDLLEKAGYTTADLQNISWADLEKIGKDILAKINTKLFSLDINGLGWVRAMINASGKWYTAEDGVTPTISGNEAIKEAFQTFKSYKDAGLVNLHSDWAQMLQAFNTGKVATVPQGNWITPSISKEESQSGKWAVVPWPRQSLEGSVNASNLGGASVYVLNLDGKEATADFVAKTFGSSTDFYGKLNEANGAMGTYIPAGKSGIYDKEVEYFGGCGIAIVQKDKVEAFKENVGRIYQEIVGYAPSFYIAEVAEGSRVLSRKS